MRIKRFILAASVIFLVALIWNGFVHLFLLRNVDNAIQPLLRSDLADKLWLSLLQTAGLACLFVWGYSRFARNRSVREGVSYGLFFALLAGLLVDLNQYVLYPIPASLALIWFLSGVLEFLLYGILITWFYPLTRIP